MSERPKHIDATQNEDARRVTIEVHKGEIAEKRKQEQRERTQKEAAARAVMDIKHDQTKVVKKGAVSSFEGAVATSAPAARRMMGGLGAILLALLSGGVLIWFVGTQLLQSQSQVIAQLPSSTVAAVTLERELSYGALTQLLPVEFVEDSERTAQDYGLSKGELEAFVVPYAATGVMKKESWIVPFAILPKTDELDALAARLRTANAGELNTEIYAVQSESGANAVYWAEVNNTYVIAAERSATEELVRVASGEVASLSDQEEVKAAIQQQSLTGDAFIVWNLGSGGLLSQAFSSYVGLDVLQEAGGTVVGTLRSEERGMRFELVSAQQKTVQAKGGDLLSFLPASATFAFQASDLLRVFRESDVLFGRNEDLAQSLSKGQQSLELLTGTPFEEGILAGIDGAVLVVEGVVEEQLSRAVAFEVVQGQEEALLDRFEQNSADYYARAYPVEQEFILDDGTSGTELVPDSDRFTFSSAKEGDVALRVLQEPDGRGGFAHAQIGNVIMMATHEQLLREMIQAQEDSETSVVREELHRHGAGSDALFLNVENMTAGVFHSLALTEEQKRSGMRLHGMLYFEQP